jgi:c(7)-type cytochrome triheme protein
MRGPLLSLPLALVTLAVPALGFDTVGGGDLMFAPSHSDPVYFSHEYHLMARGIKCTACHSTAFAQSPGENKIRRDKLTKREFCGRCHDGMKAFDLEQVRNCARCHRKR